MARIARPLCTAATLYLAVLGSSFAAPSFQLTTVFDIGGGGCVGETRVYEESTVAAQRSPEGGPVAWKDLDRALHSRVRYFLTTIGCGAESVAISLDGRSYLLDAYRLERIGGPVTYFSDAAPMPRVRIEKVATVHAIEFKETDCTQRFEKVRVRIEFKDSTRVVQGMAINACP